MLSACMQIFSNQFLGGVLYNLATYYIQED